MTRSFPTRLAASVFALGVALVVGGGGLWYRAASDTLQERLLAQLTALVEDDADRLTAWLARQQEAVVLLGRELALHGGPMPTTPDTVRWAFLPPSVLAAEQMLVAAVPGGRVMRSTDRAALGSDVVDEEYFQVGRTRSFVKKIYYAAGRPRITVAEPLRRDGRVDGVLAVHLDLVQMEATLRRRAHTRGDSGAPALDAYLVNRLFDFVSAERFGRAGVTRGVHSRAIDDALAGRAGAGLYNDFAGRAVVGAWRWIPELEMALVLETPQAAAFAPARALLARTLLLGFGALGVWVLGVVLITRRFTRPVLAVADAAKAVAAGDFTVAAPDASDDEVGQLARAFNVMTQRLRSLYASLASQVDATQAALDRAQTSRELLQDVVNNTATLVLVVGLDGRVRLANARVAALTGIPAEDAEGREVTTVLAGPAATLIPIITRARTADAVIEQEVMIDTGAGAHGWQVVAFPLAHTDGTAYATGVIGTDLTERARAEAERRARDATVQQAQKLESLGVMAGGIAHDFNNILGAIMGNVELAREALTGQGTPGGTRDDAELQASLDRIGAASRRAAELTRQMLAYAGRASLRRETLDLRQVVDDIVPLVQAGQSRKVRTIVLPMEAPLWVEADPSQLSQVLLNLLTNAAEAVGDATGAVTLSVAQAAPPNREGEAWIRIRVQDTGPGIPDAVRARIFDPFFSTKASGRGLGLSAVRGIVRSLGGVLELVTAVGEGTRFDIYLREVAPPPLAPTPSSVSRPVPVSGAVLVIDDEASIRHVARRVLGGVGFEVLDAEDGETGVARFRAHEARIVAVLLDLSMPGMSGIDVLAEIRRTHATLPVIIASGYDHDDALRGLEHDRALSFLQKPYGSAALRAEVLRVVSPVLRRLESRSESRSDTRSDTRSETRD